MWVSLFIALLTYLLSPKGTASERRSALLNAAVAGGAAYVATEYTDWGKDISNKFDGAIGIKPTTTLTPEQTAALATEAATGAPTTGGTTAPTSWWQTIKDWSPAIVGAGLATTVGGVPIGMLALGAGAILLLSR